MSGAAWTLPPGWDTASLGCLVDIQSGFACSKKNLVPASMGVAHLRPFNVGTDGRVDLSEVYYIPPDFKHNVEDYALEPGHILFNNTNSVELVGKSALVTQPMPCAFSNHIYRLALKEKAERRLEPAWLALALRQLWATGYFAEQCNRWIGQAGFNATKLKEVDIPLPPLDEQRRIVARIEALFDRMEEARCLRTKAQEEVDRMMISSVSHLSLVETEWITLEDVVARQKGSVRSGPFGSQLHHDEFVEAGVIAIGTRDVQTNRFVLSSGWYVTPEKFERFRRYQVFSGDLLVTIVGASIGRFCIVPSDIPLAFTTKHVIAVTLNRSIVEPSFASYLLNYHPRCRESIFSQTQGSAQPSLNQNKVCALALPLPSLMEQHRIVDHLDCVQAQVTELKRLQATSAAELERLSEAVLARAFKGEL